MSSAALSSARSDAAVGGSRFSDHVNHPDYEVLAYTRGDFRPAGADWIPVLDKAAGVPFGRYTNCSAEQVDRAVAAARFTEEISGPVMPITVLDTDDEALTSLNRHHSRMNSVFTGDHMRRLAFAKRVASNEVHVNDGYARHGGEGQQRAFTRRQWIGVQTTDVPYPAWAESQSPNQ